MFYSSESAINILNDMLQYEHIEAGRNNNAYIHSYIHTPTLWWWSGNNCDYTAVFTGTFHLSCVALSMFNVLENKFVWVQVLCSQKDIRFIVTDTSMATSHGY
jgi:hypothetical protein